MKLTIGQAVDLLTAHKALDGYDKIVKDGNSEKIVKQAYKLGFGFRLLIAGNIEVLEGLVRRWNKERDKLIMHHANGDTTIPPNSPAAKLFAREMQGAMETEHDLNLDLIEFDELNGGENDYPPSVLAGLMPVRKRKDNAKSAPAKAA